MHVLINIKLLHYKLSYIFIELLILVLVLTERMANMPLTVC